MLRRKAAQAQPPADDQADELEECLSNLQKHLARKQAERDRTMRRFISEEESDVLLTDLKNQTENLRLLMSSVKSDLSGMEEDKLAAMNTEA